MESGTVSAWGPQLDLYTDMAMDMGTAIRISVSDSSTMKNVLLRPSFHRFDSGQHMVRSTCACEMHASNGIMQCCGIRKT